MNNAWVSLLASFVCLFGVRAVVAQTTGPVEPKTENADPKKSDSIEPIAAPVTVRRPAAVNPSSAAEETPETDDELFGKPADVRQGETYLLRPLDQLSIAVYRQEELNQTLSIAPNGFLDYPLVPRFRAADKSVTEVADIIRAGLQATYIKDPVVTVSVVTYAPQFAYIWGAVTNGRSVVLPTDRDLSLTQAIAIAGNFSEDADRRNVILYRADRTGVVRSKSFDVETIIDKRQFDKDIALRPGDTVHVQRLGGFFVRGSVEKPGYYKISDLLMPAGAEPTLSMAIALAGDFNEDARRSAVQVIRYSDASPDPSVFTVDVEKIIAKQDYQKDIVVKSGDQIFVPSQDGVFVTGEVKKPGMYKPTPGQKLTVIRAIAQAGGFTEWAQKTALKVYQTRDNRIVTTTLNLTDFLKRDKMSQDIILESGDILYVPERGIFD